MKKLVILMAAAFAIAMPLWADTETVGGCTWTYRITDSGTAEIYGETVYDEDENVGYVCAISPAPTGAVTIPSTLGGKLVTSIGRYAFYGCSGLTSVTIPNSVTSIWSYAFNYCSGLTSVTIPNSVTSIEPEAFDGCSGLMSISVGSGNANYKSANGLLLSKDGKTLIQGVNGNVTIPDSVTSIGDDAFRGCSGLTSVTIPSSVTSIGSRAFAYCSGLTSVTIPDSVTSIGDYAFHGCTGLADESGYVIIRGVLYCYCGSEVSIMIPSSVKSIGAGAFGLYSDLTNVRIPNTVTNIGNNAFLWCTNLTSVAIPASVTSIGYAAFRYCYGLTSVMIGNGVTSIGNGAFSDCTGLTSLTIGDSVTSIGADAFYYCTNLTSVTIPNSVTNIGNGAFSGCTGLTSVMIGNGVTSIGDYAFNICIGLTSVTIPSSVTSIGSRAFAYCTGLTSVTIGNGVMSIGDGAFFYCIELTSVTIPASVTSIGDGAFYGCTSWETVHVEQGDTERVRGMIEASGGDTDYLEFVEDLPTRFTSYEVIEAADITAPYEVPKAVTLAGVAYDGDDVVGIVELKLGKVNAKKKTGKVSGSVTTLDGKKHTITAFNLKGIDGTSPQNVALKVKGLGTMNVTIGGKQFAGSLGDWHVQSAKVGGKWAGKAASVSVAVGDVSKFAGTVLRELLPDEEAASVKNGKWAFAKAAGVKWAKPKKGASRSEYYDEASGKDLVVDTSKGKTNLSGLKLTYTPKAGTFKGSFKVYVLEGKYAVDEIGRLVDVTDWLVHGSQSEGKPKKLKSYTVNVTGVVVDGVGYGTAMCKKPAVGPWPVTIE